MEILQSRACQSFVYCWIRCAYIFVSSRLAFLKVNTMLVQDRGSGSVLLQGVLTCRGLEHGPVPHIRVTISKPMTNVEERIPPTPPKVKTA